MSTVWSNSGHIAHFDVGPERLSQLEADLPHAFFTRTIVRLLKPNHSLLDVGCAAGALLGLLRNRGLSPNYTGVDLTPELVAAGVARYPDARFEVGDVCNLNFPSQSHAVVICKGTLFVASDLFKGVDELTRVMGSVALFDLMTHDGDEDLCTEAPGRGRVHLLGRQGLAEVARHLDGLEWRCHRLLLGLIDRGQAHPAYQALPHLEHRVYEVRRSA